MANKYQTLSDFLLSPFNRKEDLQKDQEYSTKYRKYVESNLVRINAVCKMEDSYYLHIKIPSETNQGNYDYDVVIRFFTDKPEVLSQSHLRGYYIQFFSNSPSFMYQYAYVYHKEGYLIEALYDKLDADYIDTPPDKTNPLKIKSYDKSIYIACRYLNEMKFRYLEKSGFLSKKEISPSKFFRGISDFQSVKLDQALLSEEKKLDRELKRSKEHKKDANKKHSVKSTTKTPKVTKSVTYVKKVKGSHRTTKKVASKTTVKKK